MKFIMTAFTNLDLALKMLAVAEDGVLTTANIRDGEPIVWTSGKSHVVLPDRSFASNEDFVLALQNNVTIAFGAAAITLNVCREEMGYPVPEVIESPQDQVISLVYQIRNCFAHDIAEPRWVIKRDRYKRVYDFGYKQVDLTGVHGKPFEYDDIGGLDTLAVLRHRLIGQ
ncbi:MAG: hypothetical protein ACK4NM_10900 [Hydrogenophaga sp.]